MSPLEALMNQRWILKSQNVELYYQVKDALKEIRKSVQEKFGYIIIVNPYLIKMEKIPGRAECWMGIQAFQSIKEYQMFCYVLMFLEDKEREEQFVLSSLTEFIQMQFPQGDIVWTNLLARRQLIRVIKYCINSGLMKQNDGDEDHFIQNQDSEVLYENVGISRYFLRNFMKEIMDYKEPSDFEQSEWIAMEEDRGIVRRQRVYRRLLLSLGIYRTSQSDDDFLYIRNYRNQIQNDFQNFFPCDLHIHKSSAFINLQDDCSMGKVFPSNNTISDLILLVNQGLTNQVKAKNLALSNQEILQTDKMAFLSVCQKVIHQQIKAIPKKYQELGEKQVAVEVMETMKKYGFLVEDENEQLLLYPAIAKITGNYHLKGEEEHAGK